MEWRLFVPLIDCEKLKQSPVVNAETLLGVAKLGRFYSEIRRLLDQLLPSTSSSQDVETRKDSYLVGSHFFGAKYRSGEKLEVKCKIKSRSLSLYGIETWRKTKLGKKEIHYQMDNIMSFLAENGYCQDPVEVTECRQQIVEEKFVEVTKSRKKVFLSSENISFEFCELFVSFPSSSSSSPFSASLSPVPLNWISLCIESNDQNAMISFLTGSSFFHSFFRSLSEILLEIQAISSTTSSSPLMKFAPMVCGYPLWVRHLGREKDHQCTEAERNQCTEPMYHIFREKGLT
jgi:hypothetical protein